MLNVYFFDDHSSFIFNLFSQYLSSEKRGREILLVPPDLSSHTLAKVWIWVDINPWIFRPGKYSTSSLDVSSKLHLEESRKGSFSCMSDFSSVGFFLFHDNVTYFDDLCFVYIRVHDAVLEGRY